MARPQAVDGVDGLQVWKAAVEDSRQRMIHQLLRWAGSSNNPCDAQGTRNRWEMYTKFDWDLYQVFTGCTASTPIVNLKSVSKTTNEYSLLSDYSDITYWSCCRLPKVQTTSAFWYSNDRNHNRTKSLRSLVCFCHCSVLNIQSCFTVRVYTSWSDILFQTNPIKNCFISSQRRCCFNYRAYMAKTELWRKPCMIIT
jgi:hypothetical protein